MKQNRLKIFLVSVIAVVFFYSTVFAQYAAPRLAYSAGRYQLVVNGKSFIITGGELGNSTAAGIEYLNQYWPQLEKMKLNTVVAPVYWELLEPVEHHFDFTQVDGLIRGARRHHMKLVLLWFGTWKNSMSCYVPGWMKTNEKRFPRTRDHNGKSAEIITPFSKNALEADKAAFATLLAHLKQTDKTDHTVLMIQVENEIGCLPDARDHSAYADSAFNQPVPRQLMEYLARNKQTLLPETLSKWGANGFRSSGSWSEVFGNDAWTDEWFMAWHFGVYVNQVAAAGKKIYPLPMYVNAALRPPGIKPGGFPSGGPLPRSMDIWKAAAPNIDFLSPDFYNPDFKYWNDLYTRGGNTLFIPEHRFEEGVAAKAFYAIGHYHAIGFSPFAVENKSLPNDESLDKAYEVIHEMTPLITHTPADKIEGVLLSREKDTVQLKMGGYILTISHDYLLPWSVREKDGQWPLTGGIIVAASDSDFYVGGTGIVITFKPLAPGAQAGILRVEEGAFVNAKWKTIRRLNGDEDNQGRYLRIPINQYGLQHIRLYNYN